MKIIFAANNSISSGILLDRFLSNLKGNHEIKIAAYDKSSFLLKEVDWMLDCLFEETQTSAKYLIDLKSNKIKFPALNINRFQTLINDIKNFSPDVLISDCENIVSNICSYLKIDICYYSNLLILNKLNWETKVYTKYFGEINKQRYLLGLLPEASSKFCVTPFANLCKDKNDIMNCFAIKQSNNCIYNFKVLLICNDKERIDRLQYISKFDSRIAILTFLDKTGENIFSLKDIEKYKDLLSGCDTIITEGDAVYLSDAIINNKKIITIPSMKNFECKMNSAIIERFKIGLNLGQFELMDKYSLKVLQKAIDDVKEQSLSIVDYNIRDFLNGT